MPDNHTPEDIAFQIATIIGSVVIPEYAGGVGTVLTDERFSEDNAAELIRLLASQNGDKQPRGVVISWGELPQQTDEGDCKVNTTYGFSIMVFWPYKHADPEGVPSTVLFKRAIFYINEKLNEKRNLDLDDFVRHTSLQSSGPFDKLEWGKAPLGGLIDFAEFDFDVVVENTY